MKKIIHYIPALVNGGIEAMLLNYYEKINNSFKFIIVVHGDIEPGCKEKFEKLGAEIYKIPHWNNNFLEHNLQLYKILKKEKPSIFHTHHGIYNFVPCLVAWCARVKTRISHCHSYFPQKNTKEKAFSILSYFFSTHRAACGIGAAEYLTNKKRAKKVKIIYNAIDLNKYKYNEEIRKKIRKDIKWENNIIYGNVGRFCLQKNQSFLIDIYEKLFELDNRARFLIIGGNGDEYDNILNKLNNSKIRDYCIVLTNVSNVNDYYSVMDVFVLPSLFEGFAVSVVEAQVSNLPCVLAPTITREFNSKNIYYSNSLERTEEWINIIKDIKIVDRKEKVIDLSKFDINQSYKSLELYYNKLIGEK